MSKDYYAILEISRSADDAEVKKAYRQAALKYHPDRNPGDLQAEENFKLASEAYEVLSDQQKRQIYDQYGEAGLSGAGFQHFTDVEDIFSSFGDIFQDFFGFGPSRKARGPGRRGRDLSMEMEISFEEACFGIEKNVDVSKHESCEACHGSRMKAGSSRSTCPQCRGTGQVGRSQGFFTVTAACNLCQGDGSIIADPCRECRGEGRMLKKKKLSVKVPAGVDNGTRLVLQGEGEAGVEGGRPGDFYVLLHVRPHESFEREGENIYSEEEISFVTAALGGEMETETLEGPTQIRIPKGTETGDTIIIENMGVPHLKSKRRGDHVVRLVVKTPKNLSKRQEELLREFAEISGETVVRKKKKGFFA